MALIIKPTPEDCGIYGIGAGSGVKILDASYSDKSLSKIISIQNMIDDKLSLDAIRYVGDSFFMQLDMMANLYMNLLEHVLEKKRSLQLIVGPKVELSKEEFFGYILGGKIDHSFILFTPQLYRLFDLDIKSEIYEEFLKGYPNFGEFVHLSRNNYNMVSPNSVEILNNLRELWDKPEYDDYDKLKIILSNYNQKKMK